MDSIIIVSVPLRGKGCGKFGFFIPFIPKFRFPSPCGVKVVANVMGFLVYLLNVL